MLAIAVLKGEEMEPRGTGFLIGDSLALTAAHVVEEAFYSPEYAPTRVVAMQVVNGGETPILWNIRSINRFPSESDSDDRPLDIAMLELVPHGNSIAAIERHRRWFFELNVASPKVGQDTVAYGFTKSAILPSATDPMLYDLSQLFQRINGKVLEVKWPYRDKALMSFPCFSVDADYESGMSGGPIFNDRDQVCGVISTGGLGGISWGSVLWPTLGMKLDGRHLLDHARSGRIRAKNNHCVSLLPNGENPFPIVSFDPLLEQ